MAITGGAHKVHRTPEICRRKADAAGRDDCRGVGKNVSLSSRRLPPHPRFHRTAYPRPSLRACRSPMAVWFWLITRTDRMQQVAQLALVSIRNPDSLSFQLATITSVPARGSKRFQSSNDKQEQAAVDRSSKCWIAGENSNVDMATEFTQLIIFQRSYVG